MRASLALVVAALASPAIAGPYAPSVRTSPTARYDKLPPYLSAPADPWTGVAGDRPRARSEQQADDWVVRATAHACTAAADHCLVADAWFFEKNSDRERGGRRIASVAVFGPDGPVEATNARTARSGFRGGPYTAYRTVPATRTNLAPGVLAVVLERPAAYPRDGRDAVEAMWFIGVVDGVDFELGTVKLHGHDDSALLTSARVAVLSWEPGKHVEILGGRDRDALAVAKRDVIVP